MSFPGTPDPRRQPGYQLGQELARQQVQARAPRPSTSPEMAVVEWLAERAAQAGQAWGATPLAKPAAEMAGGLGAAWQSDLNAGLRNPTQAVADKVFGLWSLGQDHFVQPRVGDLMGNLARMAESGPLRTGNPAIDSLGLTGKDVAEALLQSQSVLPTGGLPGVTGLAQEMIRDPERRSRVAAAGGGKAAHQAAYAGRPLSEFATNLLDPSNLVGVGVAKPLGAGLVKGATAASPRLAAPAARVARGLEIGEQAYDRLQAAPITVPLRGAKKLAEAAGMTKGAVAFGEAAPAERGLLARSLASSAKGEELQILSDRELARSLTGSADPAQSLGSQLRLSRDEAIQRVSEAPDKAAAAQALDAVSLARAWGGPADPTTRQALQAELRNRKLLRRKGKQLVESEYLRAHRELDDAYTLNQATPAEREAGHGVLDLLATALHTSDPTTYKNLERAYQSLKLEWSPDASPGPGLHKRVVGQLIDSPAVIDEVTKLAPRAFTAGREQAALTANAATEQWYARSGQMLAAYGFDHSPLLPDPALAQSVFASPQAQAALAKVGLTPDQAAQHLAGLSKLEAITRLIGATSIQTKPKENLLAGLRVYQALLEGRPLTPAVVGGIHATQRAEKALLALAHPEGLLPYDYLRARTGAGNTLAPADFAYDAAQREVALADKPASFAAALKAEAEAAAGYWRAVHEGATPEAALESYRAARRDIAPYVTDTWVRRHLLPRRDWLTPQSVDAILSWRPQRDAAGKVVNIPAAWEAVKDTPAANQAIKQRAGTDLAADPSLTNAAALQSRQWAAVRAEGGLADAIISDLSRDREGLLTRWQQAAAAADDPASTLRDLFAAELERRWAMAQTGGRLESALRRTEDLAETARNEFGEREVAHKERQKHLLGARRTLPARAATPVLDALGDLQQRGSLDQGGWQHADGTVVPFPRVEGVREAKSARVAPVEGGYGVDFAPRRPGTPAEAIASGDYQFLYQMAQQAAAVRGSYQRLPGGVNLIRLTPKADSTTLPHEAAHALRASAGPDTQAAIGRDFGAPVTDVAGEERFADAVENILRGGSDQHPVLQAKLHELQRLIEADYAGTVPTAQAGPALRQHVLDLLAGRAPEAPPLVKKAPPTAPPPTEPLNQPLVDITNQPYPTRVERYRYDDELVTPASMIKYRSVAFSDLPDSGYQRFEDLFPEQASSPGAGPLQSRIRTWGREPGILYRGMSAAELDRIRESGAIQSDGRLNIGEGQRGQTFFSPDAKTAYVYAGSFATDDYVPKLGGRPGYVVKVRAPAGIEAAPGANEVGVPGSVPAADILTVYEVRPTAARMDDLEPGQEPRPGDFVLRELRPDEVAAIRGDAGALNQPTVPGPRYTTTTPTPVPSGAAAQVAAPLEADDVAAVVRKVGGQIGAQPAAIQETGALLERLHTVNPQHWRPDILFADPRLRPKVEKMLQAGDATAREAAFRDFAATTNQWWQARGITHPGLVQVAGDLLGMGTRTQRPLAGGLSIGRSSKGSALPDAVVERQQQVAASPAVQAWQQERNAALGAVEEIAASKGIVFDDTTTTIGDLRNLRESLTDPEEIEALETLLRLEGVADTATLQQAEDLGTAHAWYRQRMQEFGYDLDKQPSELTKRLLELRGAWVDQALLSPRYLVTNVLDMAVKSGVHGVLPLVGPSPLSRAVKRGMVLPTSVTSPRIAQTIGHGGANLDELNPETAPSNLGKVIKRLPGGEKPGGMADRLVRWNRHMVTTLESVFRTWAWGAEVERSLKEAEPLLLGEMARLVNDDAARVLAGLETVYDADTVARVATAHGADPTTAQDLASRWRRMQADASLRGQQTGNAVHFDLSDQKVFEEKFGLRWWAPFHFWALRNLPFYLETLAQHPEMLRAWASWHELSEQERQQSGLTGRFKGMLPAGQGGAVDDLLDALMGPGQTYFNPLVVMSLADQLKPLPENSEETGLGQLFRLAGRVGLAPAPWIDIPLTAAGVHGPEAEPSRLLRHSGLLAGVTGAAGFPVDVEAPIGAAVRAVQGRPAPTSQRTVAGVPISGSPMLDYQISKHLAELSLEEAGTPNHPAYVAAMADPTSPLYQRAQQRAWRDQAAQSAYGFVSPIPAKRLSDTEAGVRAAQSRARLLTEGVSRETRSAAFRHLEGAGDLSTTYSRTSDDPRVAEINAGLARRAALPQETPLQRRARRRMTEQLGAEYPLLLRYLDWLEALPPSVTARSPEAFVRHLR